MDINVKIKEFLANTCKEFEDFEKEMMTKTKQEIFNENYKIRFFSEINYFLQENDGAGEYLEELDYNEELFESKYFIETLYDYFLSCEYASINNWDDLEDLFRSYLEYTHFHKD